MISIVNAIIACALCAVAGGIVVYALRDLGSWGWVQRYEVEEPLEMGSACPSCQALDQRYEVALDILSAQSQHILLLKGRVCGLEREKGEHTARLAKVTEERDALARCAQRGA